MRLKQGNPGLKADCNEVVRVKGREGATGEEAGWGAFGPSMALSSQVQPGGLHRGAPSSIPQDIQKPVSVGEGGSDHLHPQTGHTDSWANRQLRVSALSLPAAGAGCCSPGGGLGPTRHAGPRASRALTVDNTVLRALARIQLLLIYIFSWLQMALSAIEGYPGMLKTCPDC